MSKIKTKELERLKTIFEVMNLSCSFYNYKDATNQEKEFASELNQLMYNQALLWLQENG